MHNIFIADNNLDEIVFANRNKAYGAYALRKEYDAKVTQSVFIVFGSMLLLFGASYLVVDKIIIPETTHSKPKIDEEVMITEIDLSQIMKSQGISVSPPVTTPPSSNITSSNTNNYLITPNNEVADQPAETPATSNTNNPVSDTKNSAGETTGNTGSRFNDNPVGDIYASAETPLIVTEVMPRFANGDLYAYLQKNLNYPAQALREGVEGKVTVRFDIMADGSITNVKLLRGIGFGCDEEAMRVIREMPAWKPGMQAGRAVPVRMNLPIMFVRE